jgi:hypothetical protein
MTPKHKETKTGGVEGRKKICLSQETKQNKNLYFKGHCQESIKPQNGRKYLQITYLKRKLYP